MREKLERILRKIFVDECNCIVCGEELENPNRFGLCPKCAEVLPYNDNKTCIKCGKPIYSEADYCMICRDNVRYFDSARSPLIYKDSVKNLILAFKFGKARWLGIYLAQFLADTYSMNSYKCDLIVPIPLSPQRMKQRGYNQSEELSKRLSKLISLPYNTQILIKPLENAQQAKLSARERQENVKGVYKVKNRSIVKGKSILLIDDVCTTGSTLSEAAKVLKGAGAKRVDCISVGAAEYRLATEKYIPNEQDADYSDYVLIE